MKHPMDSAPLTKRCETCRGDMKIDRKASEDLYIERGIKGAVYHCATCRSYVADCTVSAEVDPRFIKPDRGENQPI